MRKIVPLPQPDQTIGNDALGWTREGILYSDGQDLRIARPGTSRLLMRRVLSVRLSGDGRRMVTWRPMADGTEFWLGRSDGTHQRRIYRAPRRAGTGLRDLVLDHRGRRILAFRLGNYPTRSTDETWAADEPATTATPLEFLEGNTPFAWD